MSSSGSGRPSAASPNAGSKAKLVSAAEAAFQEALVARVPGAKAPAVSAAATAAYRIQPAPVEERKQGPPKPVVASVVAATTRRSSAAAAPSSRQSSKPSSRATTPPKVESKTRPVSSSNASPAVRKQSSAAAPAAAAASPSAATTATSPKPAEAKTPTTTAKRASLPATPSATSTTSRAKGGTASSTVSRSRNAAAAIVADRKARAAPVVFTWPDAPVDELDKSSPLTLAFCQSLWDELARSIANPESIQGVFPADQLKKLLSQIRDVVQELPNVLKIGLPTDGSVRLCVVGDLHGQYLDVLQIFKNYGNPNPHQWYLFNGDLVDRGSFGVETCILLFSMKLLYPHYVHITRGNHETSYCNTVFGFKREVGHKYDHNMQRHFQAVFERLPLAAIVVPTSQSEPTDIHVTSAPLPSHHVSNGCGAFVVHGGLFRGPDKKIGSIRDLLHALRVRHDPKHDLVEDALWSDPGFDKGYRTNKLRGCGTLFGPDVTRDFLDMHNLSVVIRSHEGPDARAKRPMVRNDMMEGFSVDHEDDKGNPLLLTVFSAPDYPHGVRHCNNRAAILMLRFRTGADYVHVPIPTARADPLPEPEPEPEPVEQPDEKQNAESTEVPVGGADPAAAAPANESATASDGAAQAVDGSSAMTEAAPADTADHKVDDSASAPIAAAVEAKPAAPATSSSGVALNPSQFSPKPASAPAPVPQAAAALDPSQFLIALPSHVTSVGNRKVRTDHASGGRIPAIAGADGKMAAPALIAVEELAFNHDDIQLSLVASVHVFSATLHPTVRIYDTKPDEVSDHEASDHDHDHDDEDHEHVS